MLVLVRGNQTAGIVAERFVLEGIPVITENSLLLAEHPLIVQTVALLTFLDNPDDDVAFWTLITGSIFSEHPEAASLSWEALHEWCATRGQGSLHLLFRKRWPQIWQRLLAPFHSQSGLMTPYDMTLEWFARLDVEARYPEARHFFGAALWRFCKAPKKKALPPCRPFLSIGRPKAVRKKCLCRKT